MLVEIKLRCSVHDKDPYLCFPKLKIQIDHREFEQNLENGQVSQSELDFWKLLW